MQQVRTHICRKQRRIKKYELTGESGECKRRDKTEVISLSDKRSCKGRNDLERIGMWRSAAVHKSHDNRKSAGVWTEATEQEPEGIKTCGAWGLLATSIETILNGWEKEDQILAISESIRALTEEAINIRLKEVRMRQYETWAGENEAPVQVDGEEDTECLQKK